MLKVGYRIRLSSGKGPHREGVITAMTGAMLRVRWETEDETTVIPAPGTLTVLATAPPTVPPQRAVAKRGAPTKTAAKKTTAKTAAKKKAATKTAAKKTTAKTAAKQTAAKQTAAKQTAAKKTAAKKSARKAASPTKGGSNTTTSGQHSSR